MKRYLTILGIVLATLLLASCGGGEAEPSEGTPTGRTEFPTPESPVTITFWHSMTAANEETLEALADRFNSTHPWARVKLVFQGTYQDNLNKVLASLGSQDLPAVAQLEDTTVQRMVDSGAIVPMYGFIERDNYDLSDFEQRVIDYYSVQNKLYSMPFNVSNPILYYNKKAFEEVGLDPDSPPRTLQEVREYSEKLIERDAGGNVTRSGISLEISAWYFEQMLAAHDDLYVDNGNGREARATEVLLDNEAGLEIFTWWHEMVDEDLAVNVGRNPSGLDALLAIGVERVAMTIGSSAALRSVVDILGGGEFPNVELGTGPMPVLEGSEGGVIVGGASLWILKDRPVEEQEAAWEFVKFLVEPQSQAEWYAGSGYLPIRRSALELEPSIQVQEQYPHFAIAVEQLQATPGGPATAGAVIGPFAEVREAIMTAIERMLLRGSSPEDALRGAAEEANRALEDYARRVGD
ncbi:MAG: ABC transporter substrate-binding protein [Dehalococcoidia bacterium]